MNLSHDYNRDAALISALAQAQLAADKPDDAEMCALLARVAAEGGLEAALHVLFSVYFSVVLTAAKIQANRTDSQGITENFSAPIRDFSAKLNIELEKVAARAGCHGSA